MIIGLNGLIGSGKDTVTDYVIKTYQLEQMSFGKYVKDCLAVMFGWDREMLEGKTKESRIWRDSVDVFWSSKLNLRFTPRLAMQLYGTELVRKHLNNDFWINRFELDYEKRENKNIIVSDCRFINEIEKIRELGGTIIEIQPKELPEWYETAKNQNLGMYNEDVMKKLYPQIHVSEYGWIGLNNPDIIIKNDGTLDELYEKISKIYLFD